MNQVEKEERHQRLLVANECLASFTTSQIEIRKDGYYVVWDDGHTSMRWQCKGQDFYPVWHKKWPGGGTASTALSQLIRWLRGQPVLPLSSWRYWTSDKIQLLDKKAVQRLREGGYPEHAKCVRCGCILGMGLDWWSLDGVSGPCCPMKSGCNASLMETLESVIDMLTDTLGGGKNENDNHS